MKLVIVLILATVMCYVQADDCGAGGYTAAVSFTVDGDEVGCTCRDLKGECNRMLGLVCATDGNTYSNKCVACGQKGILGPDEDTIVSATAGACS